MDTAYTPKDIKIAWAIALLGFVAMVAVIGYGFIYGDFRVNGAELLANPWGVVSLVDLYVGFALFSMWIAYREQNTWAKVLWIAGMMIFGFLTGAAYVLYALTQSRGDVNRLLLGVRTR